MIITPVSRPLQHRHRLILGRIPLHNVGRHPSKVDHIPLMNTLVAMTHRRVLRRVDEVRGAQILVQDVCEGKVVQNPIDIRST